jgi:hypothetical protein
MLDVRGVNVVGQRDEVIVGHPVPSQNKSLKKLNYKGLQVLKAPNFLRGLSK